MSYEASKMGNYISVTPVIYEEDLQNINKEEIHLPRTAVRLFCFSMRFL